ARARHGRSHRPPQRDEGDARHADRALPRRQTGRGERRRSPPRASARSVIPSVLERLYGLAPRGAQLGLERVRAASAPFGHPERRFSSLHVAGTNGKGSVSAMAAAMALEGGVRVGLYTSPHLCRFDERIQIDGRPVPEDALVATLEEVLDRCPE